MEGDGMMALVHSLPDSGLVVTLLNGGRQYTTKQNGNDSLRSGGAEKYCDSDQGHDSRKSQCHCSVQATDGRYTSTYKMMHCHVSPTSPPIEVSEYPPQRALHNPGDGNFEIGGAGSMETNIYPRRCGGLRSNLYCSNKARLKCPDDFPNTLRKYPSISPDRSSEIVEKLITYSQTKSSAKRNTASQHVAQVEPKLNRKLWGSQNSNNVRYDESPTRERPRKCQRDGAESWRRSTFASTSDVRYLQDVTRRVREGIRSMVPPNSNYSVNVKTQAAVQMVSREMSTASIPMPIQKSVAVPLSPSTSIADNRMQADILPTPQAKEEREISRAVQCNQHIDVKIQTEMQQIENVKIDDVVTCLMNELRIPISNSVDKPNRKYLRRSYSDVQINTNKIKDVANDAVATNYNMEEGKGTTSHKDLFYEYNIENVQCDANDENLKEAIERWLNKILIKTGRCIDPLERDFIFQYLYKRLKQLKKYNCILENNSSCMLKSNISQLLNKTEPEVNMPMFIDKLTDLLLEKIRILYKIKRRNFIDVSKRSNKNKEILPLENEVDIDRELKSMISTNLHSLLRNIDVISLTQDQIHAMENELLDVYQIFIFTKDYHFLRSNIKHTLKVNGLREKQVIDISEDLFNTFITEMNKNDKRIPTKSRNLIVFPAIQIQSAWTKQSTSQNDKLKTNQTENFTNKSTEDNYLTNVSFGNIQKAVEDWLNFLDLQQQFKVSKETAVNFLASEINNRQKYLYWNHTSKISNKIELDYLKYQIFKWSIKCFHVQSIVLLENAENLLNRIQRLSEENSNANPNRDHDSFSEVFYNRNQNMNFGEAGINQNITVPVFLNCETILQRQVGCCQSKLENENTEQQPYEPNEDYKQFVKKWVQEITVDVFTLEEENIAEKARVGIHNGIWKAITRLNGDPSIYSDQFLYEDLLENEIDDLIDCLPQTPQLTAKRHCLKVRLIEKTISTIKYIYKNKVVSLKNMLVQKIEDHLQSLKLVDTASLNIKFCIFSLAENFILFTKYAKENQVRASIYSKKLSRDIETLFNILLKNHNDILETYTMELFQINLIKELQDISFPNDALFEEADKILLEVEIDQWLIDLPLPLKSIYNDENERRALRDKLTRQIKELDNYTNISEDDKLIKLNIEICKFLEQLLSQKMKNMNINFLADELLNRINNMRQSHQITTSAFAKTLTKNKLELKEHDIADPNVSDLQRNLTDKSILGIPNYECERPSCITFKENNNVQWYTLRENKDSSNTSTNNMKSIQPVCNPDNLQVVQNPQLISQSKAYNHNMIKGNETLAPNENCCRNKTNLENKCKCPQVEVKTDVTRKLYKVNEENSLSNDSVLSSDALHDVQDPQLTSRSKSDYLNMINDYERLVANKNFSINKTNLEKKCNSPQEEEIADVTNKLYNVNEENRLSNNSMFNSDALHNVQDPQLLSQSKSDYCNMISDYERHVAKKNFLINKTSLEKKYNCPQDEVIADVTNRLYKVNEENRVSNNSMFNSDTLHDIQDPQLTSQPKSDYCNMINDYERLVANKNFSINKKNVEKKCNCPQDEVIADVTNRLHKVNEENRLTSNSMFNSDALHDVQDPQLSSQSKSDYCNMINDYERLVANRNFSINKTNLEKKCNYPQDEVIADVTNRLYKVNEENRLSNNSVFDSDVLHDVQNHQLRSQSKSDYCNMINDNERLTANKNFSRNKTTLEKKCKCLQDGVIADVTSQLYKVSEENSLSNYSGNICDHKILSNYLDGRTGFNSDTESYFNTKIKEGINEYHISDTYPRECQTETVTEVNVDSKRIPFLRRNNNSKDIATNVLFDNHSTYESLAASSNQQHFTGNPECNDDCQCFRRFRNCRNRSHFHNENYNCPPFIPMFYPYPYFL